MEKELEVKILNINVKDIVKKLEDLGANFLKKENQENIHIFSNNFNYIPNGSYLRIRSLKDDYGNIIHSEVTFKENILNNRVRENNEYTSTVKDRDALLSIFEKIGYDKFEVGQKTRYSYSLKKAIIDIDIWDKKTYPYPYMEIEVSNYDDLYDVLDLLEISRSCISLKSLKQLQEELKGR